MSGFMKIAALALTAFLVGSPREAPPVTGLPRQAPLGVTSVPDAGPPFGAATRTFASAAACSKQLAAIVQSSTAPAFDAAAGPYVIATGDTRAHRIKARDWGHEIEEFRCLDAALSSRRWTHSMSDVKPFTVEDIGGMSFPAE